MADQMSDPAELVHPGESRLAALLRTLRHLDAGRLADAAFAGSLLALLLAMMLGKVKLDVIGALATLCVVLILLALATFDLVVRWSTVDLQSPGPHGPGAQRVWIRLLGRIWPEVVLVAGIIVGHLLWTG
jgi:hypothetical protein